MKFYKCDVCGRFVFLLDDETFEPKCCGKPMQMLKASVAYDEKHTPVMTTSGDQIIVNIGKIAHPMDAKHRIEWITLDTNKGYLYQERGGSPNATFKLEPGQKINGIYAYCNIHGLWAKKISRKESINRLFF